MSSTNVLLPPVARRPAESGARGSAPTARRIRRLRWRDLRLWVGVALMIVAMVAGARILSGGQDTIVVWRATRDLPAGAMPVAEPAEVQLGSAAGNYLSASEPLEGRLRYPIAAGSLMPVDAVGGLAIPGARLVTLPVDPLHAPVGLAAGDVVDVWATGVDASRTVTEPPTLVLPSALVSEVDWEHLGVGGEVAVVLEVPQERASALLLATRSRLVDLVAVPLGADGSAVDSSAPGSAGRP